VRGKCPTCGRKVKVEPPDEFSPFCSQRCRLADLGKWLDGGFRISSPASEEDLDEGGAARDADDPDDDKHFRPQ
jgi:endogenous inhibitor of DNA gyrase (YacG/DUF329 family)